VEKEKKESGGKEPHGSQKPRLALSRNSLGLAEEMACLRMPHQGRVESNFGQGGDGLSAAVLVHQKESGQGETEYCKRKKIGTEKPCL